MSTSLSLIISAVVMVAEINVASSQPFTETHHLYDASDVVSIRNFTLVTVSDSIQPTVTNFYSTLSLTEYRDSIWKKSSV